ncbi:MAG: hypothetical protein ACREUN_06185 [Burkholderiales bacterium]
MLSELPLPELEPMPLLLGVLVEPLDEPLLLGVLLLGELLDEPLLLGELEAPPLLEPLELDLKCASHSVREIWPSLLVSTVVKLGALEEAPLLALPPLEELLGVDELLLGVDELPLLELPLAPLELLPVALGEDLSLEAPVEDEPELCAMETLASAKSAAAVAVVISFNFMW